MSIHNPHIEPFIHNVWAYYITDTREAWLACCIREGRLSDCIDANRSWLRTLKRVSLRRWSRESERLRKLDARAEFDRVRRDQPYADDNS